MKAGDPVATLTIVHVHVQRETIKPELVEFNDGERVESPFLPGQSQRTERGGFLGIIGRFVDNQVTSLVYVGGKTAIRVKNLHELRQFKNLSMFKLKVGKE